MSENTQEIDRKKVGELVNQVCSTLAGESEAVGRLVVQVLVSIYELDTGLYSGAKTGIAHLRRTSNAIDVAKQSEDMDIDTTLAEMMADATAMKNTERVLIVGYWFQICNGATTFTGFEVNNELGQLGYRSSNITADMTRLMERKPQLVIQVQKSGKSKQARKTYKLTAAGMEEAKGLISSGTN